MRAFIITILCLTGFTAIAQSDMQQHYKIYDTRNKQLINIEQIVSAMADADVLFFGEEHNDSAGHFLEAAIFKALHTAYGNQISLSLEMFETDGQLVLNEYLAGLIDEARMGRDLRLWSNYKDYRPMIEYAKANQLKVVAANPPRRYVTMVSRKGMASLDALSKEAKQLLPPLPYDTLTGRYREKFMDIMKGSPGSGSNSIYHSQSLWDAGMSYSIHRFLKANRGQKVFHCVGKFHSDEKLGTAAQLQLRNKKLRILNISCFPDKSFANPDWESLSQLGDFVILTNPDLKRTY